MSASKIITIETDNPPHKQCQAELVGKVDGHSCVSERAGVFYKRFLSDKGIQTRYFGLEDITVVNDETPDEAASRFQRVATEIGSGAVLKCLKAAGLTPSDIDGLIVTTCTGYLCPGLTSYVAQRVGFRDNIYSLDLAGTGCGAAMPALHAGDQYLKSHPNSYVMVVSAEVCSAALFWGDEIELILSNSIFADGAAACLMSNHPDQSGYEVLDFESVLWPEYRDDLRFKYRAARLCNVITKDVPVIASKAVKLLSKTLSERIKGSFDHYAIHPGGRRILDEIGNALGLKEDRMQRSREILRDYGNMSSPSVLFVLKNIIQKDRPKKGENIILFSFGAGFSAFGAALRSQGENGRIG